MLCWILDQPYLVFGEGFGLDTDSKKALAMLPQEPFYKGIIVLAQGQCGAAVVEESSACLMCSKLSRLCEWPLRSVCERLDMALMPAFDPQLAIRALEGLEPSFVELLREATPWVFSTEYHSASSSQRYVDMVEMYCGTRRISLACQEVGCC